MVYLARAQLLLDMTLTIQKANELAILFGVYAFIDHPARDSKEGKILKDDSDPYTGRGTQGAPCRNQGEDLGSGFSLCPTPAPALHSADCTAQLS